MKERQEKQYSETIIIDKEQEKTETKVEFSKEQIFGMIKIGGDLPNIPCETLLDILDNKLELLTERELKETRNHINKTVAALRKFSKDVNRFLQLSLVSSIVLVTPINQSLKDVVEKWNSVSKEKNPTEILRDELIIKDYLVDTKLITTRNSSLYENYDEETATSMMNFNTAKSIIEYLNYLLREIDSGYDDDYDQDKEKIKDLKKFISEIILQGNTDEYYKLKGVGSIGFEDTKKIKERCNEVASELLCQDYLDKHAMNLINKEQLPEIQPARLFEEFNRAKQDLLLQIGSPEYLQKMQNFGYSEKKAKQHALTRAKNISLMSCDIYFEIQSDDINIAPDTAGQYKHQVVISPRLEIKIDKEHKISFSDPFNNSPLKKRRNEKSFFAIYARIDNPSIMYACFLHELLHAAVRAGEGISQEEEKVFKLIFTDSKSEKLLGNIYEYSYIENYARLAGTRTIMINKGIMKYGEPFTPEHYEALKKIAQKTYSDNNGLTLYAYPDAHRLAELFEENKDIVDPFSLAKTWFDKLP
jgi:hypothetical protein